MMSKNYAGREEKPPYLHKDVMMSKTFKFIYPLVDIVLDTT